ncbi:MAG TPA: hypothetical protein VE777_11665 [Gaiellales bacterium]|nr:hypothetical protein [Gaiellales bacterium]
MTRVIILATLALAMLAAQPAAAGVSSSAYTGQTRRGTSTYSRTATGSCHASAGLLVTDLVLRCASAQGRAKSRYHFTLPRDVKSFDWHVNYAGSHGGATASVDRAKRDVYVTVEQTDNGSADIESVMISYYC